MAESTTTKLFMKDGHQYHGNTLNILITGHKGYIGSNLLCKLGNKYKFTGLTSVEEILKCDEKIETDYVIHLASKFNIADSVKHSKECFEKNITASKKLFDLYPTTPIIFASSSTVNNLKTPYAQSKFAIELIAPKNVTILRFFSVYGGINYRKDMVYGLAKDNKLSYVNTKIKRDYIHVNNVINTIDYLIQNPKPSELFDVGTGKSIHVTTFLKNINFDYSKLPLRNTIDENDDMETCARKDFILDV